MRPVAKRLVKRLLFACRSKTLYHLCRRYISACDNDNQEDMAINGEIRLLRDILPHAETVFDVGANVGRWTRAALDVNPRLHIHCFEPSGPTFHRLLENDFPPQVVRNHFALGDRSEQAALHIVADSAGVNSLYRREAQGCRPSRTEMVDIRTLDDYCSERNIERIDLLKIDVEGHELAVLRGSREMLRKGNISSIQFEYGGTYMDAHILLKDVWTYMAAIAPDYAFCKLYPNGPKHIPQYTQALETFQQSNWLIQRRDTIQPMRKMSA